MTINSIPAGATYTVKEKEVTGYTADKTTASGTIAAGSTASAKFTNPYGPASVKAEFSNERRSATLTVTKTTSATGECLEQLKGNNMYSQDFASAEFTVKIFDKNTGTWGTEKKYVTGTDGKFTITGLYSGDTVSVTETKAPKGYLIPSQATQTVKLAQGSNSLTFKDDPTFDPATPTVYKARYENGKIIAGDPVKDVQRRENCDNVRFGIKEKIWQPV